MANIYGWKRNSWRYNKETVDLVERAKERESWSSEQWKKYVENRTEFILHRALTKVPYYKQYWREKKRSGDQTSPAYLEHWPVLSKETVRNNSLAFLAEDCNPQKMYHEHTSGTSGKPVHVYWSKETTTAYYALFERRIRQWHDVNRQDRYVILGGQLIIPVQQNKPPYWINNWAMNHLYMSSYHISERSIKDYVDAINAYKPAYFFGYASSLYSVAVLCEKCYLKMPSIKAVISNAEPLYDYQVKLIKKIFNCTVVNTYGMSELVAAGCSKNDFQSIHLWPEVGIIETFDFRDDMKVTGLGRFIATSLINPDFCLIRYEVGDAGVVEPGNEIQTLPLIRQIEGRIDDLVVTADGRRIGRLDPVFKGNFNIIEAQIVQEAMNDFIIKVVPSPTYTEEDSRQLIASFKERLGDVRVLIRKVEFIEKGPFGKFKAVISKVNKI